MGAIFLYAVKSALCLAMFYLPYSLLLQGDALFAFNRKVLLSIVVVSLLLPLADVSWINSMALGLFSEPTRAFIEVGMPVAVVDSVSVPNASVATAAPWFSWALVIVVIYFVGAALCLVMKAVQMVRLLRFIPRGCLWTDTKDGVTIYCHLERIAAFSFFRSIVISEADYQESPEIIRHEMAHIRKGHSYDAMLLSVVEVLQWFNPCVWMLDFSLRDVHEFEADSEVLKEGISAKSYQLILIRKAVGASSYAFTNSFNHSLLKKRIAMMLKKNQSKWSRAKALYFLPVAAFALCAFATPELSTVVSSGSARSTASTQSYSMLETQNVETRDKVSEISANLQTIAEKTASENVKIPEQVVEAASADSTQVFNEVEKMPQFPGGMGDLMKFIATSVRYPESAQKWNVQGRVIVGFVVNADGSISDASVIRFIRKTEQQGSDTTVYTYNNGEEKAQPTDEDIAAATEDIKSEALRVVDSMPDWIPGEQDGRKVAVKYVIPLTFRLQ